MKPLQIVVVVITLVVCLAALAWIGRYAPALFPSSPDAQDATPTAEETASGESDEVKDFYMENPFLPIGKGPHPHAEVPEIQFSFGRMALGETGKHDFVVKNTGDVPLKLAKGPVQCKCTLAGLKDRELEAGAEAKIHLEWTPKSPGPFAQTAVIWTNDPEMPKITIGVDGTMHPEVVVSPQEGWTLGPVAAGRVTPLSGSISSGVLKDGQITGIEVSSDQVEMKSEPWSKDRIEEENVLWGYDLQGVLKAGDDPGPIQEQVTVHTNLEKHPTFEFMITGTRTGALTIIGPNWYAGQHLIDMGNVQSEKGKELKFTMMLAPAKEELKFTKVEANPPFVRVRLKPENTGSDLKRERYSLFVEIPKGSPAGIWSESRRGHLMIETNHPEIPRLELNLDFEVRK